MLTVAEKTKFLPPGFVEISWLQNIEESLEVEVVNLPEVLGTRDMS